MSKAKRNSHRSRRAVGGSKPRKTSVLLVVAVALVLVLLLLRMVSFVAGHGHHGL